MEMSFYQNFFSDLADDVFGDALAELKPPYMCTCVHVYMDVHTYVQRLMNAMHWIILSVLPPKGELAKSILLYCFRPVEMTCQMHDQTRVGHTQSLFLFFLALIDFQVRFDTFNTSLHVFLRLCVCVCHKYLLFCELLNIYTKQIIICVCHFNF